jgi:hypothetical protein
MKLVTLLPLVALIAVVGCATTQTALNCDVSLKPPLRSAMAVAEDKLNNGCETHYDQYIAGLIEIAKDNPGADNKKAFSDFLIALSDQGTISKRQARSLYNRYFNVKFVSLAGDYSTCSEVCPVRDRVLLDMRQELLDKEIGLLQASNDSVSYYRSDLLLKESEIVIEATCRACSGGIPQ